MRTKALVLADKQIADDNQATGIELFDCRENAALLTVFIAARSRQTVLTDEHLAQKLEWRFAL